MSLVTISDTSIYLKQDHYFNKLKDQLCKDFGDDDFDAAVLNLHIEDAQNLFSIVNKHLNYLETQSTEIFFRILYRIDIPEADFKAQILENGLDIQFLSELVIKRELIKILMREQYS